MRILLAISIMFSLLSSVAQQKIIPPSDFLAYGRIGFGGVFSGRAALNAGLDIVLHDKWVLTASFDYKDVAAREYLEREYNYGLMRDQFPSDHIYAYSLRGGYQLNNARRSVRYRLTGGPAYVKMYEVYDPGSGEICQYCKPPNQFTYKPQETFGGSLEAKIEFPFAPGFGQAFGFNVLVTKRTVLSFTYQLLFGSIRPRKVDPPPTD